VSSNRRGSWCVFINWFFKKMKRKFRFGLLVRCVTRGGGDTCGVCVVIREAGVL
jgi:hypothetical protein